MYWLKSLYYSFPIQLLLLHFQRNHLLLIFWVLPLLCIVNYLGRQLGLPYLFLDPEYLGKVSFFSFFFIGISFGGFAIAWNITTYILHSFRFPFLATLRKPFTKYTLNNALLPLFFLVTYIIAIVLFQYQNKLLNFFEVLELLGGLIGGIVVISILSYIYFLQTNKDIFGLLKIRGMNKEDLPRQFKSRPLPSEVEESDRWWEQRWRVDTYLAHPFRTRLVRSIAHYDNDLLKAVFRQNHSNALIMEAGALIVLISLGFLINYPVFRIPAGASIFLLISVLTMLAGALGFLLKKWSTIVFVLFLVSINFLMKYDMIGYQNKAFGLDYSTGPISYNYDTLQHFSSKKHIKNDKDSIYPILENWKQQFSTETYDQSKPKMVFINVSGGGLRSAVWTFRTLQYADSLLEGDLMKHTFLITGASGGMIGAAYFRELLLRKKKGQSIDLYDNKYVKKISKDLLNAVAFAIAVNDLFYPFHHFTYGGHKYRIDRGYAFERQLNENTSFILDKPLQAYRRPERRMKIPLMVLSPVIINDARSLLISPQPVNYLTRHLSIGDQRVTQRQYLPEIDGVDFRQMFDQHEADSLRFTTALRMNATFPYVTPSVNLPTKPSIDVMDAGMRDNFGVELAVRFAHNFRTWIHRNTSGIVYLQIRDIPKVFPAADKQQKGIFDKMFDPIGGFYMNWQEYQDFHHEHLLELQKCCFPGKMDVIVLQYLSQELDKRAALSWHLTTREKQNILEAIDYKVNQASFEKLERLLSDD